MKPERLLPLILLVVGIAFFYFVYRKKTDAVAVPEMFRGNQGIELFYEHQCVTCHTVTSLPEARGLLGPGLDDIGLRSLEYNSQGSGEDYIKESILYPSKVVREGFINGMPSYEGKMTEAELDALVAWLYTLKGETESK